jgi:hypothetical protein
MLEFAVVIVFWIVFVVLLASSVAVIAFTIMDAIAVHKESARCRVACGLTPWYGQAADQTLGAASFFPEVRMTPEERERIEELCKQIAVEKVPAEFDELVFELNKLLEDEHRHAQAHDRRKPSRAPYTRLA